MSAMLPTKVLTPRGYSFLKSAVSPVEAASIQKDLTVCAKVPRTYAGAVKPFKVYLESDTRYYLPVSWAQKRFGEIRDDIRAPGVALPPT